MGQDRCATCTIVSFFSRYRCLCMLQLTMHSPVMGAAVIPEAFTQIRAMPPRRINAPEELKASTELTVQSCCIANPNGGKLSALGTRRRRFEPSRSNSNHRGMRSTLSFFARGSATSDEDRVCLAWQIDVRDIAGPARSEKRGSFLRVTGCPMPRRMTAPPDPVLSLPQRRSMPRRRSPLSEFRDSQGS